MGVPTRHRHGAGLATSSPGASFEIMPPEAPLDMPVQSFGPDAPRAPRLAGEVNGRRAFVLAMTAVLTVISGAIMADVLALGGWTVLDSVSLVLFAILFAWVAFSFISATAGFAILWRGARQGDQTLPIVFNRTALLMPTYGEEPARILSAMQAMHEDLKALGVSELYDLFVLSDTRDEAIADAEAAGVVRLRMRLGPDAPIFYRRRTENTERKAGNIADWVRRFGGSYDHMLVLDADSIMSGRTIVRLTAAMEADPKLGLLQSSPGIINGETLFGRLQQFAGRIYGPITSVGQDWWSGSEGNFWGHNALIRTRAFAACSGMPHLKGRKPIGGHIMSHDFVEAALLRRGGWAVRMAPSLGESFEETPPTIQDMAKRDRRWCQGNLQHAGVVGANGLHWVSRLHLVRGILSYATAPLWLFLLLAGAGSWIGQSEAEAAVIKTPAIVLFGLTMTMLIAPKLMSLALTLRDDGKTMGAVGVVRLLASAAAEIVLSTLVAPVLMLIQAAAVFDVLRGRDSGWTTQQRDPSRLSRGEAWRSHRIHVALGLAGMALAWVLSPPLLWWTSPVCIGLVLSAPLALVLSSVDLGRITRRLGLFTTPEETDPPAVVVRAGDLRDVYDREAEVLAQIGTLFDASVRPYRLSDASPVRHAAE